MNLSVGNKNVIIGLLVIMAYLLATFFIERTAALHAFHDKAAEAVIDAKNSANLMDHQVVDFKRGPAYRTGGIYFKNYYPASYVRVPNFFRDAGYNMRIYAWIFALFNIVIGAIVGIQNNVDRKLRAWSSWLGLFGVLLFPLRDAVFFWGRWLNPDFSPAVIGPIVYPVLWAGCAAMFLALVLSLVVFIKGSSRAAGA